MSAVHWRVVKATICAVDSARKLSTASAATSIVIKVVSWLVFKAATLALLSAPYWSVVIQANWSVPSATIWSSVSARNWR